MIKLTKAQRDHLTRAAYNPDGLTHIGSSKMRDDLIKMGLMRGVDVDDMAKWAAGNYLDSHKRIGVTAITEKGRLEINVEAREKQAYNVYAHVTFSDDPHEIMIIPIFAASPTWATRKVYWSDRYPALRIFDVVEDTAPIPAYRALMVLS